MDQNFMKEAGQAIRRKRRAQDLTQSELAAMADMTMFSLQRIERGDSTNTKTLDRLFNLLDIKINFE